MSDDRVTGVWGIGDPTTGTGFERIETVTPPDVKPEDPFGLLGTGKRETRVSIFLDGQTYEYDCISLVLKEGFLILRGAVQYMANPNQPETMIFHGSALSWARIIP